MNPQSPFSDADDSTLFRSSIIPKRKATESLLSRPLKQSKLLWAGTHDQNNGLTELESQSNFKNTSEGNITFKDNDARLWKETKNNNFEANMILKNNCPLCQHSFESDSNYMAHMKLCAKKYKLTSKQLLSLLVTQKNRLKDYVTEKPTLSSAEQKPVEKDLLMDQDLPSGFTLAKSLKNDKNSEVQLESMQEQAQNSSLSELNNLIRLSPRKKRNKKNKIFILPGRTTEERQRIITEKAAVILLDENNDIKCSDQKRQPAFIRNPQLKAINNKVCRLWNLSENEQIFGWYVKKLKALINYDPEDKNQEKNKILEEKQIILSQESDDFSERVSKLNLPKMNFYQDWRKMINNQSFSDLIAMSREGKIIYLHSLILNVRCPTMMERNWKSIFDKFSFSTILCFLEYVYCGTINSLKQDNLSSLLDLASDLNFQELTDVLSCFETNSHKASDEIIISSSPDYNILDVLTTNNSAEAVLLKETEDKDMFEDMKNLTQNSSGSSTVDDEIDESNLQKSYWSFMEYQKRKVEEQNKDAERELSTTTNVNIEGNFLAVEKNDTTPTFREELIMNNGKNDNTSKSEIQRNRQVQGQESSDCTTKDLQEEFFFKNKKIETCIIISSDSESLESKSQEEKKENQENLEYRMTPSDCDMPYFDPYENYNHFSDCNFSPVDLHSQSLVMGEISKYDPIHLEETMRMDDKLQLENQTTPMRIRRSFKLDSSGKKSFIRSKKRRSDLTASRIVRKSLRLPLKSPKATFSRRHSKKKRMSKDNEDENWLNQLTNSLVQEFTNSPTLKSSTPVQIKACSTINKEYIEMTPCNTRDVEIEESVTPYPNYSRMEEGLLKEHLAKYGLKRNLGKRKAQKILKHIYEELHPYLNKETGKLVRKVITETPKNHQKRKSKVIEKKGKTLVGRAEIKRKTKRKSEPSENGITEKNEKANDLLNGNSNSFDDSMLEDSNGSDYDDLTEVLTQSVPSNPKDLPLAMMEFLKLNPEFHEKILTYEPIWVRDLQLKLKEAFKKHYKMEDLVNYLDQKCITFRTNHQKFQKAKKKESSKKNIRSS